MTKNGLTLRVVAGTHSAILGIDLQENKRKGCFGFSIQRIDLGSMAKPLPAAKQTARWLPNMLRFPGDKAGGPITTETAPLQKFRWGDYTLQPGTGYRFKVVPRYGKPGALTTRAELADGVEVEVTTEDPTSPETAIFFNRAAAASRAFDVEFPHIRSEKQLLADTEEARKAKDWLSNGLEEAILAFLAKAVDKSYALHAAVYEFQKPELLAALKAAADRGVDVQVAYHHRQKNNADKTAKKNDSAIEAAKFGDDMKVVPRTLPQRHPDAGHGAQTAAAVAVPGRGCYSSGR